MNLTLAVGQGLETAYARLTALTEGGLLILRCAWCWGACEAWAGCWLESDWAWIVSSTDDGGMVEFASRWVQRSRKVETLSNRGLQIELDIVGAGMRRHRIGN